MDRFHDSSMWAQWFPNYYTRQTLYVIELQSVKHFHLKSTEWQKWVLRNLEDFACLASTQHCWCYLGSKYFSDWPAVWYLNSKYCCCDYLKLFPRTPLIIKTYYLKSCDGRYFCFDDLLCLTRFNCYFKKENYPSCLWILWNLLIICSILNFPLCFKYFRVLMTTDFK